MARLPVNQHRPVIPVGNSGTMQLKGSAAALMNGLAPQPNGHESGGRKRQQTLDARAVPGPFFDRWLVEHKG